jgi:predicted alpha/beta hydrolase
VSFFTSKNAERSRNTAGLLLLFEIMKPVSIPEGKIVEIHPEDGAKTAIRVFKQTTIESYATVICIPALGVPASYYLPLVSALYEQGLNIVTSDLRGLGLSTIRASKEADFGYHELLHYDFPAVISMVQKIFPSTNLFLLGHSLGGQLSCLYGSLKPDSLSGIILVASCSLYYKGWPFPKSFGILLFEQFANLVAQIMGYFPGRFFRFGGQEARSLMRDWSHQGLTGRYEVAGNPHDFEYLLSTMALPVLSISFDDDTYSPKGAVSHLLDKMRAAKVTDLLIKPSELGQESLGHFGWVKKAALIAPYISPWIKQRIEKEVGTEKKKNSLQGIHS